MLGPVILIGLGVIFLLNNLGLLEWDVWWTLLRIWPVFLIAIGIDLLFGRRSTWGSLLALVLIVAVFAVGIWLAWQPIPGAAVTEERITQALEGSRRAKVTIGRSVGIVQIGPISDSRNLVEGTLGFYRGEKAKRDFRRQVDEAIFALQSHGQVLMGSASEQHAWQLKLNESVPLALEVNTAAGELDLDLSRLQLEELEVSLALGRSEVFLPGEGRFSAKVSGAMGQTIVYIPEDMEARIRFSTGLVSKAVPSRYREVGDKVFESPGYNKAESRMDLEIRMAFGSVEIREAE